MTSHYWLRRNCSQRERETVSRTRRTIKPMHHRRTVGEQSADGSLYSIVSHATVRPSRISRFQLLLQVQIQPRRDSEPGYPYISGASLMPRLHQDTCSLDTSCSHLYPLSPSTVHVFLSATKLSLTRHNGDMYPLVSGYKLLVRDTCIRLHVSRCKRSLNLHSRATKTQSEA